LAGDTFNPYHVREFYNHELIKILTHIFGQQPEVYFQRPIQKDHRLWSFFQAFILQKESRIIKEVPKITGMDMIYLIKRKQ